MHAVTTVPFKLGTVVQTPGARDTLNEFAKLGALQRYQRCDWGEVSDEDWDINDAAVVAGDRILAAYRDANGTRFWIITEADRSHTTILLPDEY